MPKLNSAQHLLNQTFFKGILVGDEGKIAGTILTPVYEALSSWHPSLGHPGANGDHQPGVSTNGPSKENPDPISSGQGSLLSPMVNADAKNSNRGGNQGRGGDRGHDGHARRTSAGSTATICLGSRSATSRQQRFQGDDRPAG